MKKIAIVLVFLGAVVLGGCGQRSQMKTSAVEAENYVAESPVLEAIPATEAEYLACGAGRGKWLKKEIREDDRQFYLTIHGTEVPFVKDDTSALYVGGKSWSEYMGYYPDPGLYAVCNVWISGDLHTFSELVLIDPETGGRTTLDPLGNAFWEVPTLSPGSKYFAHYYNDTYSGNDVGQIRIFAMGDPDDPESRIAQYAERYDYPFFIEDLAWKSDAEIVLKAYTETFDGTVFHKTYAYYKILIG